MRWSTRLGPALLLALGLAAGPAAMAPAAAHGGEIDVELGSDGAGGVSAALTWAGDEHPVEESAVVVVRAVAEDGTKVGPVTLASASEGVGWYRSEAALLEEGHWTVTAQVKKPKKAKVTTQIDVVAPPEPPDAVQTEAGEAEAGQAAAEQADTDQADTEKRSEADASGPTAANTDRSTQAGGLPGWTGWALAAVLVAGAATVVVVRRRTASGKDQN